MTELFEEYFVLYKPKDIVSGDFYWVEQIENKVLFSAVDCTGHGVPGAFMSLVGANGLNQAVVEHNRNLPSDIMDELNSYAMDALNKNLDSKVRDGMDMALCLLDKEKNELHFSGANNPLYLIRGKELIQYSPDKFAIGSFSKGEKNYTNNVIPVEKNDTIVIFSDGYADQFGGPKGKKFMYKRFRETLVEIVNEPLSKQKQILDRKLNEWMGDNEQIDDILIFAVRV